MIVHGITIDETGRHVVRPYSVQDRLRNAHRDIVPPGLTIRAMLNVDDQAKRQGVTLDHSASDE